LMYPAERVAYMLADSGTEVVVTSASLRASLPELARVVEVDTEAEAIAARPDHAPQSGVGPDHLAYVIYTSGSTGEPKGVMVCHRGVANLAPSGERLGRFPDGRVL